MFSEEERRQRLQLVLADDFGVMVFDDEDEDHPEFESVFQERYQARWGKLVCRTDTGAVVFKVHGPNSFTFMDVKCDRVSLRRRVALCDELGWIPTIPKQTQTQIKRFV